MQLQAVFNAWSTQIAFRGPLTASTAALLGYIVCGAPDSVIQAMTLQEFELVSQSLSIFANWFSLRLWFPITVINCLRVVNLRM
jgi:hypothetical protein